MARVQTLFLSRPWTTLVPDAAHTVVTAGFSSGLTYVAAARASDGATVMAYLPAGGTITVDMSKVSGHAARAWWFNPRDGMAASAGAFPASGQQDFKAPDTKEWVLVIDDAARHYGAPGTSVYAIGKGLPGRN
jgi:hypothetical protein